MLRANNEANVDVYIDDSLSEEKYHCPICDRPVFRKIGNGGRRPHFAHNKAGEDNFRCDGWKYDMSDWHREWQERFPVNCREVVVSYEGKKHRADVLIEEKKLVVEFQHSRLSPEEYAERNQFYSSAGYHVIWLFDMADDYREGRFLRQENSTAIRWNHPWNTFRTLREGDEIKGKWDTNVEAVFFENAGVVSRLLSFDNDEKFLHISSTPTEEKYFTWSDYSFSLFLNDIFSKKYLSVPECPECHIPMVIRRNSITRGLFWGCYNYFRGCTERKYFGGMLPEGVSNDGECKYCGKEVVLSNDGIKCNTCGFVVNYIH